ncbi:VOC family protein [Lentzea sp. NPDC060358]|uniref:VOC family protein n=1 Tax=Lentzea sp. NPDC060358 TaxID=3347103 RepID=UPI0036603309
MATRLNPYISFDGQARQAMEFYQSVFGGELKMSTFGEFGMQDAPQADQIMHAQLETDAGYTLMASDTPPGMEGKSGSRITVSLSGDDEVLREYFAKLAEGGQVGTPLEKQMWGDEYGDLTDRFGVNWMVNLGGLG